MNFKFNIKPVQVKIDGENVVKFEGASIEVTELSMKEYIEFTALAFKHQRKLMFEMPAILQQIAKIVLEAYKEVEMFNDTMSRVDDELNERSNYQRQQSIQNLIEQVINDIVHSLKQNAENKSSDSASLKVKPISNQEFFAQMKFNNEESEGGDLYRNNELDGLEHSVFLDKLKRGQMRVIGKKPFGFYVLSETSQFNNIPALSDIVIKALEENRATIFHGVNGGEILVDVSAKELEIEE